MLDQSVFTSPAFVSWKAIVPFDETEPSRLSSLSVVHASVKPLPLVLLTVTRSVVGTVA